METEKSVLEKGISYSLNLNELTAKVIKSPLASGDIFIPYSINFESVNYLVTRITKNSFSENNKIKSINFPSNSALKTIENESFSYSSIESIFIPSSVSEIQDGWLNHTSKLQKITISSENSNYKYDDKQNFIFGRSNSKSSNFDVIVSANRLINIAQIPSFIKHIDSFAFSYCMSLKVIIFEEQSELESIGDNAFLCSSIINIKIPKKVQQIKEATFSYCKFLQTVSFDDDSELKIIDQFAFKFSSIKSLFIPEKVEDLKDEWCNYTNSLTSILVSPMNKNLKYLNEDKQIIIGKSNLFDDSFDSIFFANRNIEVAIIPSSIRYLKPSSFCNCNKLKIFEFQNDSNLVSIGQNCFAYSSLIDIKIPNHVIEIEKGAFTGCLKLKNVLIEKNSELNKISSVAFSGSLIKEIFIPKKVTQIGEFCFSDCRQLEKIEIDQESELKTIERFAFTNSSINSLFIPEKVVNLKEEWCHCTLNLNKIFVSPMNKNFGYLDESNQIVIGKSNSSIDFFDSIYFANREIETVFIPSYIQHIKSSSFGNCKKIKSLEFSDDSNLISIGKNAFSNSSLKSVKIPKHVKEINEYSFSSCKNLHLIKFYEDSELEIINQYAFSFTFLMKIEFPKSVKLIQERSFECCTEMKNLEFSGIEITLNQFCFKDCLKLCIISFPNVTQLTADEDAFSDISVKIHIFLSPNANLIYK